MPEDLSLWNGWTHPPVSRRSPRLSLKASIVGLRFGISVGILAQAGWEGLAYTAGVVLLALVAGRWLGRLFRVPGETSLLIASGIGICGASASAAVARPWGRAPSP